MLTVLSATIPLNSFYPFSKKYRVTIYGTSNLHNWQETVEEVAGNVNIDWNTDSSFNLNAINLVMKVKSIKSDRGYLMNENTYKALKADEHPNITFKLKTPLTSIDTKSGERTLETTGNITVAGVTRDVFMTVKITSTGNGVFFFEGTQIIKMSDYGIKPPRALLGTLKTGNNITVVYKTHVEGISYKKL